MAVQKVDYEDKIGLQNDPNVPNKSKVTDEDMNQLKSKINNNADELNEAQGDIEDLQQGQGATNGDIASLKNRVSTLELDNTRNKQDIANKVDKVDGKGLSTEDYTTAEKQKLAGLNNYDDTEIKEDIQDIKSEQTTQNTKLQELDDNQIHITTERASNLNVQDASGQNAKINVFGISKQEGTPSPENSVEIENTTGNVKITNCNKNLFDEVFSQGYDSNGNIVTSNQFVCNTNLIDVVENESYTISNNLNLKIASVAYYKDNKFISFQSNMNLATITIPQDVNQIRFNLYKETALSVSDFTFCQFEKKETATDFVAHEEEVITFPLSQNQKMYDSDYLARDGIHHKRKQRELDGTENIQIFEYGTAHITTTMFNFTNLITKKNNVLKYCSHFKVLQNTTTTLNTDDNWIMNDGSGNVFISIKNDIASTVEEIKAYLAQQKTAGTPVTVEYPLSEEEVEAYTEEQQETHDQLQNAKTYKTVTNVFTDNAEVEMNYIADAKTYVDNEINSIKNQLNTINQLLSTTTTSAMLLDNMQSDLESEVL